MKNCWCWCRAGWVGGREQRAVAAMCAIGVSAIDVQHRTPGESRVDIEDPAEGPAPGDLFDPTVAAVKEDGLPYAKELEPLAHVVVTAAVIQAEVVRVELLRVWLGARVHALCPCKLNIGRTLAGPLHLLII